MHVDIIFVVPKQWKKWITLNSENLKRENATKQKLEMSLLNRWTVRNDSRPIKFGDKNQQGRLAALCATPFPCRVLVEGVPPVGTRALLNLSWYPSFHGSNNRSNEVGANVTFRTRFLFAMIRKREGTADVNCYLSSRILYYIHSFRKWIKQRSMFLKKQTYNVMYLTIHYLRHEIGRSIIQYIKSINFVCI